MAKKIKYNGTNVTEYAASGGNIPGIKGSESVMKNYFLHQLHQWQSDQNYKIARNDLENMFSDFPAGNKKIKANVMTRSGTTFSKSNSYVKSINYIPPKVVRQRTYTTGNGTLPTTRTYMRYIIVGGGGGGGKGTSPRFGTGIGGAGGGGGGIVYGEAAIGGYNYEVGAGGAGATAHGNRGASGGNTSIYKSYQVTANGGTGGGNETLTGPGGSTYNSLTNNLSWGAISGQPGGRNRAAGSSRSVPSLTNNETLGLGDLIDGGSQKGAWRSLLLSSGDYFGTFDDFAGILPPPAPGGAGRNINGGPGGGGASLGKGGTENSSAGWDAPGTGGGGGGSGGKRGNGQKGGNGFIHIFW